MKNIFLCYPKCTTCLKAKKFLEENKIEFMERNIKEDNPNYNELKEWYQKSKLPLKKFFNTSGLIYKELNLKEKLETMSEEKKLEILSENGMLIKRPLWITDDFILCGFKEKEWEEKILGK